MIMGAAAFQIVQVKFRRDSDVFSRGSDALERIQHQLQFLFLACCVGADLWCCKRPPDVSWTCFVAAVFFFIVFDQVNRSL
ncbi:hypothetical protein L6452_12790 [Arctium lappa]|uniref:Uncharacterized protein n=1 Tax=Arctium lappa TaxID=4217 RepID=A0ACB9CGS4_ARCLA|nr:hypothetical protein L6452_12790 [Arctium lappa]